MRKIVTTIVLIMLLIVVHSNGKTEDGGGYKKDEILLIKWGNGENKIGLNEEDKIHYRTNETYLHRKGPYGFSIDGVGNIYLGDLKNKGIIKYSQNTNTLIKFESIKKRDVLRFYVDKSSEDLFILDRKNETLEVVGPDNTRKPIEIDPALMASLVKPNTFVWDGYLKDGHETIYDFDAIKRKKMNSRRLVNSIVTVKYLLDMKTTQFSNLGKLNANCNEVNYKWEKILGVDDFLNMDLNKNLYYLCAKNELVGKRYKEPAVLKINLSECNAILIDMENNTPEYPDSQFDVDNKGNIYQMQPKEDGVHIIKWSK